MEAGSLKANTLRGVPRPLRVGVQLPEVEREVRWPEYASIARAAERAGFDSIWVGDHLLYRHDGRPERGPWDAWTLLAGLAVVTERVSLGPLVACTAFRPPAVLAKQAATVHELSGDRLVLGLGAGWNRAEFEAFGLPFDHRASRFEEAFEIVRGLLSGDRVTFEGRFHQVRDAVLLPRPEERPELMVGSTGERVLTATLPHVDAWNTWYDWFGNRAEGFERANVDITELARQAGRAPEEIRRTACALVVLDPSARERPPDEGVPPIAGPASRIAEELRSFADAGGDEVIVVLDPITEPSVASFAEVLRLLDA